MKTLPPAFSAMASYSQFILYKIEISKIRSGKTDKFPIDYRTGYKCNAHDPNMWLSFDDAVSKSKNQYHIGFVLTAQDPFFFIDLDNCLMPCGTKWSQTAIDIMSMFKGAGMEISASNRGLHIIAQGDAPRHSCKNSELNIEFYTEGRFIALTRTNAIGDAGTNHTAALITLADKYFTPSGSTQASPQQWTTEPCAEWDGYENDEELIFNALRSKSSKAIFGEGASFADLWDCNVEKLSSAYPDSSGIRSYDESSADAALAQSLAFWTGNNCERILNLMQQSKLKRIKWEREDYLRRTILNVCARQKEPHKIKNKKSEIPIDTKSGTYLDIGAQNELFKGCVYVQDEHRILIPGGLLLKPEQFRAVHGGYNFPMDLENRRVSRNAWEAFTESQIVRRPRATSTCFRPDQPPGTIIENENGRFVNTWWPVKILRIPGDVNLMLDHLKRLFPSEHDYLVNLGYMAALVQHLGVKFQWCPLIQGVEGNGKTLLSTCMEYCIGRLYSHFPQAMELADKYNGFLYKKMFIGVEDIYVPKERVEFLEIMKPMITRDFLELQDKYGPKTMREICCNFILNSNHKDAIPKNKNDRRFAIFFTPQQNKEDLIRDGMINDYFPNIWNWLYKQGGFAKWYDFLCDYEIQPEYNPALLNPAPFTTSLESAISHNLTTVEQEIMEAIEEEILGFKNGWVSSFYLDKLLIRTSFHRRLPPNRRKAAMQELGYDWHPSLKMGRVNNPVLPDNTKSRLYVKKDHYSLKISNSADVATAYTNDQLKNI